MVRNIEVKRGADTVKIKMSFFRSAQCIREIIRSKMSYRKFTVKYRELRKIFEHRMHCNQNPKGRELAGLSKANTIVTDKKTPDALEERGNVVLECINLSTVHKPGEFHSSQQCWDLSRNRLSSFGHHHSKKVVLENMQ